MEQWKSYKDVKGKAQAGETPVRPNTDDLQDGRLLRCSDEAPVMGVEPLDLPPNYDLKI